MLRKLRFISRPEYIYRPGQLWRRMQYELNRPVGLVQVLTPWGLPLLVNAEELHGRAMLTLGICDLRVSELLHRILRPGDCAIDVGANVGAMTSLMARRTGTHGKIYAVEPHPETRKLLARSVALWGSAPLDCATVEVLPLALSNTSGAGTLEEPDGFAANSGLARIAPNAEQGMGSEIIVETRVFDEVFHGIGKVRLVKVDVEGHEDAVLDGMCIYLAGGGIDFLIFEEFRPLPSVACEKLQKLGYSTYLITRDFWGPKLVPTSQHPGRIDGEPTNVLAVQADQSLTDLKGAGWQCLRARNARREKTIA